MLPLLLLDTLPFYYRALFAQQGGRPFRTLPEDGAPLRLAPGDRLLLDGALWVFSTDGARG